MAYINWNPDGNILDLGFIALRWYSALFALGFVLSYILLKRKFKAAAVSEALLDRLTVYVVLATIIGARLGHCVFYDFDYYSNNIAEIFLPVRFHPEFKFVGYQGLASHGGIFAIMIAIVLFARNYKLDLLWLLDKLALVGPLAGALIRLGNLMNSEIIGNPTSVTWAFVFERVDNVARHPAQLYEAMAYFIIFITLNMVASRTNRAAGFIFGCFLVLMFLSRFVLEFLKTDQAAFESGMLFNIGQLLSVPFILLGIALLFISRKEQWLAGNFEQRT
jgi:phosphatidylglycerol---prolipoprotein diacylglyceryl transferase